MANYFKSKYTGEQIESLLDKTNDISVKSVSVEEDNSGLANKITIDGVPTEISASRVTEQYADGKVKTMRVNGASYDFAEQAPSISVEEDNSGLANQIIIDGVATEISTSRVTEQYADGKVKTMRVNGSSYDFAEDFSSNVFVNVVKIKNYQHNADYESNSYYIFTNKDVKNSAARVLSVVNPIGGIYGVGGSLRILSYSDGVLYQEPYGDSNSKYQVNSFNIIGVKSGRTYTPNQDAREGLLIEIVLYN